MTTEINKDLLARAIDHIDRQRLVKLVMDLVDIPSPTGEEEGVARALHEILGTSGFDATLQPIGDDRYNAIGRQQGAGRRQVALVQWPPGYLFRPGTGPSRYRLPVQGHPG